jgi:hypothetical protein
MWARDLELSIGLWLGVSPFVFAHAADRAALWLNDFVCAAIVAALALACYWPPMQRAHWGELAVAAWLVGFGWVACLDAPTPAAQNHILVGLLLGMFAIVPTRASQPPEGWSSPELDDADLP